MPEGPLTPDKRRIELDPDLIDQPPRAPFVELGLVSNFSFLRGASDAVDLVLTARALGYDAIGIADANSMAGIVRIHTEATTLKLRPIIGARIETVEGLAFLAYPTSRAAYGRLCRLISAGRMSTLAGEWQDKGVCDISLAMLAAHAAGEGGDVQLILLPPRDLDAEFTLEVPNNVVSLPLSGHPGPRAGVALRPAVPEESGTQDEVRNDGEGWIKFAASFEKLLPHLTEQLPTLKHIAASFLHRGDDIARIDRLDALARANGLKLLATNDVHYHAPDRRPLQDVMTAIRHKTTVAAAGRLLHANAERHLKSPAEMQALFARWPHAITAAARQVADACTFSLDELRYEYPEEIFPNGQTPQEHLVEETWKGAKWRYPMACRIIFARRSNASWR